VSDDHFESGTRVRREVLGDAHVDRATASTGIDADFQRWLTEVAWGGLWSREQLDRRTRSCITIAVLTALRAEHELRIHIPAGRRNGLSDDEIAEVIMHTAGYAGIPAANAAMAIAKELLAEPPG
jgi:4-carboxymuconolactone decarboxylase